MSLAEYPPEALAALALVVVVPIAVKIDSWAIWRRERRLDNERRLAADADYQHWHAQQGDQHIAIYGRFAP